jgi:tripartite-type tricarboxylate transporter receptor subunit TctC
MKLPRRKFLHLVAGAAALASAMVTLADASWSQARRPIRVVVAAPPGGASDTLARFLVEQIGRTQGLTILVENRPGAGTAIGTGAVSRAAPDGNTLLIVTPPFVINPHLRKLNYDPLTNFEPICNLVQSPSFIVVNSASPYHTLDDLLSAARAKPDVTLAGAGPGTSSHIAFEMLKRAAGINMTFVPFPGDAPAVNALLGEHVTSASAPYSGVAEQLKAGKLRALAVSGRERVESFPNVPTIVESGFKDSGTGWSRPGIRQGRRYPKSRAGSLQHCRVLRSGQSSLPWAFIRSGRAARILLLNCASNTTSSVA